MLDILEKRIDDLEMERGSLITALIVDIVIMITTVVIAIATKGG